MSNALLALSPQQLDEALGLVGGSDSIELKLTVPDADRRSTVEALGMDVLDAQIRQVFFFDTPDLRLNAAGVVVRARRVLRGDDSVVKLRPVVPEELAPELRKAKDLVVEVDVMPGGYVCSASYKRRMATPDVRDVVAGERPLRRLFSKPQRAFYEAHAPDGIELDALEALGPVNVLKLKFSPKELGRRMVAELWVYPDFSRILELSTKCLPGEGMRVGAETRAYLSRHGVDLTAEQQTKTKTALEYFAQQLAAPELAAQ
jgi:hypothetical protein